MLMWLNLHFSQVLAKKFSPRCNMGLFFSSYELTNYCHCFNMIHYLYCSSSQRPHQDQNRIVGETVQTNDLKKKKNPQKHSDITWIIWFASPINMQHVYWNAYTQFRASWLDEVSESLRIHFPNSPPPFVDSGIVSLHQ